MDEVFEECSWSFKELFDDWNSDGKGFPASVGGVGVVGASADEGISVGSSPIDETAGVPPMAASAPSVVIERRDLEEDLRNFWFFQISAIWLGHKGCPVGDLLCGTSSI